jgi:CspA family cold shock protein
MKGKVKRFDNTKGYGFIQGEDGNDVFFHYSVIQGGGFKTTREGDDVDFEFEKTDKGLKATKVIVSH